MNDSIAEIAPFRWKVGLPSIQDAIAPKYSGLHLKWQQAFQVLLLDGENTGADTGSIRDARNLIITTEQFQAFLERHKAQPSLVPEDNDAMKDSYLNLDEEMR